MFRDKCCMVAEACGGGGPSAKCKPCIDVGTTAEAWDAAGVVWRRRTARHEAAHAVIALALGRHVEYVCVYETDPHVIERGRADGPRWLHDTTFVLLAGELAEEDPSPPDYADCRARIAASRQWLLGSCDACKVAFYLAGVWGEGRSDDQLALFWVHLRATVMNLLAHPVIAEAVDRLADRLGRRPLLLADDLAVILNATALRAAAAEMLPQAD